MSSWIKTDIDFGLPYKNLIVRYHSPSMAVLDRLLTAMSQDSAERIERDILALIKSVRPELSNGLILCGIRMGRTFHTIELQVVHQSFERRGVGSWCSMPTEEYLEPCAECLKPMPAGVGEMTFVKDHPTCPGQMIEICKECYGS